MKKLIQKKYFLCALLMLHTFFMFNLQSQNPVGAIPGVIDVSPMGAATYTIPIEVVPGTQGVQPNLSIVYNSYGDMGLLGMKWNLSGLSAITRCSPSKYYNDQIDAVPISFTVSRFALDGERLINIGSGETVYSTEEERFTRIHPISNHTYFIAYIDDGSIMKYGSTVDSRQIMKENTSNTLTWFVDTITDFNGNYMSFKYKKPNNDEEVLIEKINYTGNKKSGMQTFASIDFEYCSLPDTLGKNSYFVAGFKVQQTKLLKYITVNCGGIVRKYEFIYNMGEKGERTAHLKQIVLYGDGGKESLNATNIIWEEFQYSNLETETLQLPNHPTFPQGYIMTGDFDGDGLTDYVIYGQTINKNKWTCYFRQPNGSFKPSPYISEHPSLNNEGICYFYKADVDGDGKDEVIIFEKVDAASINYKCKIFFSPGNTFEGNTISNFSQVLFGDFNNDGKTEILVVQRDSNNYDKCTFQLYDFAYNKFNNLPSLNSVNSACKVRVGDFSGNGKTDIELHLANGEIKTYWYNASGGFTAYTAPVPGADYNSERYSGDFNGDGITDLLTFHNREGWRLYFGKGDRTYTNPTDITGFEGLMSVIDYSTGSPYYKIMIADFDGDGKDDIIQFMGGQISILYSKGCIANSDGSFTYKYKFKKESLYGTNSLNIKNFCVADFDNDGILDLVVQGSWGATPIVNYYNKGKQYDLTKEITDGMGKTAILSYKPQYLPAQAFNRSPSITKKFFLYLVNKMQVSNGINNGINTFSYSYAQPVFSNKRRTFLGFKEHICTNVEEGRKDVYWYWVDSEGSSASRHIFLPKSHQVFHNSIESFATSYRAYLHNVGNRCYVRDYHPISADKLTKATINNNKNKYSDAGRLALSETWTEEIEPNREMCKKIILTEIKDYSYKTIVINGNQKRTVLEKIITKHFYEDNHTIDTLTYNYTETGTDKGRLNWERQGNFDGSITTKYNNYNTVGNCLSKTLSAAGCDLRTETYVYDNTQRFITQVTNPEGHISKSIFDGKTGNKLADIDPNSLITTYQYDVFGNLTQINNPDGTKTTISHNWHSASNPPNAKYYTTTTTSGKPTVEVYYDVLGREVCRKEDGYFFQTIYNKKGQVQKTSNPFLRFGDKDIIWHEYTYDNYGRKETEKSTAYIDLSYSYDRRKVTITDNLRNIFSSKDYDGLGRIIEVIDFGGNVKYEYIVTNDKKHKTIIKTNDVTTIILSDLWGNRLSIDDPNAGKIVSTYNKFNELETQTDARGNITKFEYDKLGRVNKKQSIVPGGTTAQTINYIYDNATGKGIGKLSQIKIDGTFVETFFYDNYSRLSEHKKTIENASYSHKYTYNNNGQLDKLTYPENFAVNYKYTPSGRLDEIFKSSDNSSIYKVNSRNKYHSPMSCDYGNDITTSYEYNFAGLMTFNHVGYYTSELHNDTSIIIIGPNNPDRGGPVYFNSLLYYSYDYNNKGLMFKRKETIVGRTEDYKYDELDRLSQITVSKGNLQLFSYAPNGNIEEFGTGEYSYHDKKPNAVIKVINGAQPSVPATVTYNFVNQPTQIKEGNNWIDLYYDADQQRQKAVKYKNSAIESTRFYINKYYEKETSAANAATHYYYIYGDDGAVALHTVKSGVAKMYYLHPDHLGSYCAITDADKKVVQRNHFDPWGNPVGTANFTLIPRGFTGHEHYPDFKIINMNARLYDPVIGRFFSPDTYVVENEGTQDFNRYSYCRNNPLKYKDPSGNRLVAVEKDDWVIAKDGTKQFDPNITKDSKLKEGETYLGETYRENGAFYRKDGSIMFSKESAAISRMLDQSTRNGNESWAALTDKGTLVLPDYVNQGTTYDIATYGYSTRNGNIVDAGGTMFNTFGSAHTHLNGGGPSYYTGNRNDYGDLSFASFGTPNKPVYVLQMNNQKTISYIVASPNTTMKKSDFNYRINIFSDVNTDNLRNGSISLGGYTKQTNFLQLLRK